jgi:hypothetical protein
VRGDKRLRRRDDAFAAPVLAVPVERLPRRPAFEDEIERFAQPLVAVGVREPALVGKQRARKSRAEAEDETAAAWMAVSTG